MKPTQTLRAALFSALIIAPFAQAGDTTEPKSIRIVGASTMASPVRIVKASNMASPVHDWINHDSISGTVMIQHDGEVEAGPSTFLGVETSKVSATLGKQLGLDRGIGLVIARVIPETGAAEVLEKHDILVKFEDQLAISPDQLGVLVRSKEPGAKVALTIFRGGKEQIVSVELREGKAKTITLKMGGMFPASMDAGMLRQKFQHLGEDISREEVEELMGSIRGGSGADVMVFSGSTSPVVRMMNVRRGNVVFSDDEGTTKLLSGDGGTRLIVMDQNDEVIFDGPVDTEEQRANLDEAVQGRLEKVEDLRAMEMKVDHDFEIEDNVHVTVPHASMLEVKRHIEIIN